MNSAQGPRKDDPLRICAFFVMTQTRGRAMSKVDSGSIDARYLSQEPRSGRRAVHKLMLKIATAALLALASIAGSSALLPTESVAESVVTGPLVSVLPSDVNASELSGIALAEPTVEISASINAPAVDLIAAGGCAALIGCCILGLALLRLRLRGDPRSFWTTVLSRRILAVVSPSAPLTSAIQPSLILLSISRT